MRLTKLELSGFKSFADSTQLVFDTGVTAIVGPNGCGKSNVSDAVRWVLGEQRVRALRGAKMDEVIFQGSSARRAVNVAEVSLHFDNTDGGLQIPYREVVITRRLNRSGDSEYFINRSACRLRDVQDLLRGTGLGADASVIIESKMIDALLSDRPDERRELFEEAAGVGLYRDRRRSTERRLEETAADLSRLDDLLSEVQTHVRSLARQRRKAERHAELTTRRLAVEVALASHDLASADTELAALTERLADLRERIPAVQAAVQAAEGEREGAASARSASETRRAELARLVADQRRGVAELQGEVGVAEERQRNAVTRRQRAEDERQEGVALGDRVRGERELAETERRDAEAELARVTAELEIAAGAEEAARAAVSAARLAVESVEREARELRDRAGRVAIEQAGAERESGELGERATVLERERETLRDRVDAVTREITAADEHVAMANTAASAAGAALETAQAGLRDASAADAAARATLARGAEALTALDGKVSALEALERERVGLAPAAAKLLAERVRFGEGAILGPLSDFIVADQDAAAVVERFLGATLHAVVIRDSAAADAIRAWHATSSPGPLLLLPLDSAPSPAEPSRVTKTGSTGFPIMGSVGAGIVDRLLAPAPRQSAPDAHALLGRVSASQAADAWVRALLDGARDLGDGIAFADGRGAVWLPGTAGGPGPLRRRAELTGLRAAHGAAERARADAATAADAARDVLAAAQARAVATAEAHGAAQQAARQAADHREEHERRRQRAERELHDAAALADKLGQRAEALAARIAELRRDAAAQHTALESREASAGEARVALTAAVAAHEEARERRTAQQVTLAQTQARVHVAADRARRLGDEFATATGRLDALQLELASLSTADAALAERLAAWRIDLATRSTALVDGEAQLAAVERAVADADEALGAVERTLADARRTASSLADESHHAEVRHTELSGQRIAIHSLFEGQWQRRLSDVIAETEPLALDPETLRDEAAELHEQLSALGPVNALAIEEHDEEQKRLEFVTRERADITDAKASLQQAIREIDTTAREMFLTTFTQVRENFRQIFMTLFGGGECDLRLENPDAPLDCDIEIHASPRGKRTQRIHLLSSGERALVALSLLFGIFLTKPSPFCLLDEVDAPLDDQNIGRFVRMLIEFKMKTQFIVITHNPRTTTEAADAVYGVTMQEPGVSSLVGVRLRDPVLV
jgi:chromosome segregation protein